MIELYIASGTICVLAWCSQVCSYRGYRNFSIIQDDTEQSYDVTQHGKKPKLQPFIAEHLEQVSIIQHYDINAHDYQLLGGIATSP